jgi:hypothetical protein
MIVVIVTRQIPPSSFRESRLLPAERAALSEACLTSGRLAQDLRAALADDDCVGVREDGGDGEASGALDVHEERAGGRHKGLELVLLGLSSRGGVEKVNGENHFGGFVMCPKRGVG